LNIVFYKKFWFWAIIVIALIAGGIFYSRSLKRIEIRGYEVKKRDLVISVTGTSTGTIKSDNELKLTAQRIGRINKLFVEEGSEVAKGALIAELDTDEVIQRRNAAAANIERLRAGLEAMKLNYNSYKTDLSTNLTKAQSVLAETETRQRRLTELKNKGYLAAIDLDAVTRELEVAKASYAAAVAAKEMIKSRDEEIKAQEAALRQAVSEYNLANLNVGYSSLHTSIPGYVTTRPLKPGDTVLIGTLVASVVEKDSLYIEGLIDEADVAKVKIGQTVNISMDAYLGKTFKGEVYLISPVVLGNRQEARTFEVRVRFLEKGMVIKPGMSADVEIVIDKKPNAVVVPSAAIVEKNTEKFLYVVRNGRAVKSVVTTGDFNWSFTEIKTGVTEGDIVVMNPDAEGLKNGIRVTVVKTEK